jgi:hypothetical protein
MSDAERGESRAQGALDNFLHEMEAKLYSENRSREYCKSFWAALYKHMETLT